MGNEKPWAAICFCLMFGLIVVIWAAYGIADATSQDTFICKNGLKAIQDLKLPGGERDPKYSMSPWSIGQRDCAWFSDHIPRCALPALFSEAKDLCIDQAYWTDKYNHDCIWWTQYVTGTAAMWSPRKDGFDPKCNSPPPNKPMTDIDLLNMKSACCVCGGGLVGRDYAGPAIAPDAIFKPPPVANPPEQHKGKTSTHLTQCTCCWHEAEQRAIVGKSGAEINDIKENKKLYNNPRGGKIDCLEKMELDFDKRRDLLTPFIIGASVITALILCLMACVWWCGGVEGFTSVREPEGTPFLVKL